MKFTVQAIRGMSASDGLCRERSDDDCPGLVIRVGGKVGATRRTFFARYTVKGESKRSMFKLGEFPEIDLRTARERTRKAIADARDGIDPKDVKQAEALTRKEETRAILDAPTFEHFAETFIKNAKATRRRATWIEDERIAGHCVKHFGDLPIATIGPKAISDYLDDFIKKPRTRNQYRAVLLSVFEVAIEKQAVTTANPVLSVKRSTIHPTDTNPLPDDELRIVLPLLDESTQTGQIARLHLYTGQRPGHEIAHMRLGEIDFKQALWRLPGDRAKNHRQHEIPLSTQALRVLEKAKRSIRKPKSDSLMFPSRVSPEIPFTSYKKPFRAIRKAAIDEHGASGNGEAGRPWVLYDFKDTLMTRAEEIGEYQGRPRGFPFSVVQRVANHRSQAVTRKYTNPEFKNELRELLGWWGSYCDELEGRRAKLRAVNRTRTTGHFS